MIHYDTLGAHDHGGKRDPLIYRDMPLAFRTNRSATSSIVTRTDGARSSAPSAA
jgi:hypothetical protein